MDKAINRAMENKKKRYEELLKKKDFAQAKLDSVRKELGHPHLDFMSAHDLAESQFGVWTARLREIESEIAELEKELGVRG